MPARIDSAPVVVWGGGTGGVAAAIQSARAGAPTVLLTPGSWLGGMVSAAGVCCPDGNELSPWQTGLWGAFLRGMAEREPEGLDQNWVSCFGFRPIQAEALLQELVVNAGLGRSQEKTVADRRVCSWKRKLPVISEPGVSAGFRCNGCAEG